MVHKVMTSVIRRIDVNHFYFTEVGFLEEFQCVKVVANDEHVLCIVKIFGSFHVWTKNLINWRTSLNNGLSFTNPSKVVRLIFIFQLIQRFTQRFKEFAAAFPVYAVQVDLFDIIIHKISSTVCYKYPYRNYITRAVVLICNVLLPATAFYQATVPP